MKASLVFSTTVLICLFLIVGCTPKLTAPVVKQEPAKSTPPPKDMGDASPCTKFSDAQNPEGVKTAHVLYRDFIKQHQMKEAVKR